MLGAVAVSTHSLTLGGLVAFITLALQLVWPVEAMGYIIAAGQEAATAAQRVLEIFDTDPEITDKISPERAGVHALTPGRGPRWAVPGARLPAPAAGTRGCPPLGLSACFPRAAWYGSSVLWSVVPPTRWAPNYASLLALFRASETFQKGQK